jgi:Na+-transporting methylmalonyl-CoA/oxaloacetate decarboxylase gamma subunit
MENELNIFLVLAIGMGTVFVVLGLVVFLGQTIIKLSNLFGAEVQKEEKIIKAIISKISDGKGELISFEKIAKTK